MCVGLGVKDNNIRGKMEIANNFSFEVSRGAKKKKLRV